MTTTNEEAPGGNQGLQMKSIRRISMNNVARARAEVKFSGPDEVVTVNVADAPQFCTESGNPRLKAVEKHHFQAARNALWGADSVAELLRNDAFHRIQSNEDAGVAYTPLSDTALQGLHMALMVLLGDTEMGLDRLDTAIP